MIGDDGFSSFTDLKKTLKVSTGTIYHHLETLSHLIEQKSNKKYYLTDLGIHAYNSLKENIEILESPKIATREFRSPLLRFLMFLTPKKFITFEKKDRAYNSIISLSILSIGAILCGLNAFYSFFLFFIVTTEDIYRLDILSHIFFSLLFLLNFLIFYILVELCCLLFYKKKQRTFDFFLSFPIIFYPMILYLFIHFVLISTELLIKFTFIQILDIVLLIFFQVLSLWLLTYNISLNKELKIESSLIIALLLHWGSFTIVLFILI